MIFVCEEEHRFCNKKKKKKIRYNLHMHMYHYFYLIGEYVGALSRIRVYYLSLLGKLDLFGKEKESKTNIFSHRSYSTITARLSSGRWGTEQNLLSVGEILIQDTQKLCSLCRARQFYSPKSILDICKSTIHSCL